MFSELGIKIIILSASIIIFLFLGYWCSLSSSWSSIWWSRWASGSNGKYDSFFLRKLAFFLKFCLFRYSNTPKSRTMNSENIACKLVKIWSTNVEKKSLLTFQLSQNFVWCIFVMILITITTKMMMTIGKENCLS